MSTGNPSCVVHLALLRRDGTLRAIATIDASDRHLAEYRWHLGGPGYAMRSTHNPRRELFLHREILGLSVGDGHVVDHIDGDKMNNRRSNLRVVTHTINNRKGEVGRGVSRHRGVTYDKRRKRWVAQLHIDGRHVSLGYFLTEVEAAEAARAGRAFYYAN